MTEPTQAHQQYAYTPPTLRIAATYPVPQVGEATAPAPGWPDNVEVEFHASHPDHADIDAGFVTAVIQSLFRAPAVPDEVVVTDAAGEQSSVEAPTPTPPAEVVRGLLPERGASTYTITNGPTFETGHVDLDALERARAERDRIQSVRTEGGFAR